MDTKKGIKLFVIVTGLYYVAGEGIICLSCSFFKSIIEGILLKILYKKKSQ